jgi:hypothetical protein
MQNNKNGGRVRLKDIQNMLAKYFNIHYQNINGKNDYYTLFIVLLFFEFGITSQMQ